MGEVDGEEAVSQIGWTGVDRSFDGEPARILASLGLLSLLRLVGETVVDGLPPSSTATEALCDSLHSLPTPLRKFILALLTVRVVRAE